jgi:small subunit ribosomal protein S12
MLQRPFNSKTDVLAAKRKTRLNSISLEFSIAASLVAMASAPSILTLRVLRSFLRPARQIHPTPGFSVPTHRNRRTIPNGLFQPFTTSCPRATTLNQVRNGCRKPQKKRRSLSPAMVGRPEMKGVCLKVGITKPKKPNSGQRKTAKVRLSSGRIISAYIPGEGAFLQLAMESEADMTANWVLFFSRPQCAAAQRRIGSRRAVAGLPRCAVSPCQRVNGSSRLHTFFFVCNFSSGRTTLTGVPGRST